MWDPLHITRRDFYREQEYDNQLEYGNLLPRPHVLEPDP